MLGRLEDLLSEYADLGSNPQNLSKKPGMVVHSNLCAQHCGGAKTGGSWAFLTSSLSRGPERAPASYSKDRVIEKDTYILSSLEFMKPHTCTHLHM